MRPRLRSGSCVSFESKTASFQAPGQGAWTRALPFIYASYYVICDYKATAVYTYAGLYTVGQDEDR